MQYSNVIWRNGQPYSEMFDDIYYSSGENESIPGEGEFNHVFFNNNHLPERWQNCSRFVIGELGFGSGLNCLLTMREWLNHTAASLQSKCLHYIAIEKYPLSPDTLGKLFSRYPQLRSYADELIASYPPAIEGVHSRYLFDNRVVIHYRFMDVIKALMDESLAVDAWYLDGFSPASNPDMWSSQVFELLAQNSHQGTTCSTYSSAGFVRRNMQAAGFNVNRVDGHGNKREMLTGEITDVNSGAHKFKDRPWFRPPVSTRFADNKAMVIGDGIAGLSAAHALIKRGWDVSVIDRHGDVITEATSNPAPIVYPRLSVDNAIDTDFFTTAYHYTLHVFNALQQQYQQRFWFGDGLLQLTDTQRIRKIINKFDFNRDYLAITEDLDSDQATVEFPSAGVVLPAVLTEVLKQDCGDQLTIVTADVTGINRHENQWQCLAESRVIDQAPVLIIANGTGINELGLPVQFPIEAIRGQVVELNARTASRQIRQTINASVHVTPVINDKHYLGATYIRNCNKREIDPAETRQLLASLDGIYPGMFRQQDVSNTWVGFRAMSKDRVPIVGAVPDNDFFNREYADICHGRVNKCYRPAQYMHGLYISAAHGSRGFTSSLLCAQIIAAIVEGEPAPVAKTVLDYLSPSRFIVNDLKRG